MKNFVLSILTLLAVASAQAGSADFISLKPGKLLKMSNAAAPKIAGNSLVALRLKTTTQNPFATPQVVLGRQNKDKACQVYNQNLVTSDYSETSKAWTHVWEVKLSLVSSAGAAADCFVTVSYPGLESSYVLLKGSGSFLPVKNRKSKHSSKSDSSDDSQSGDSRRSTNCPSFDCQDEPRRSTSRGGPDDITDDPSRDDDDSSFDGGGYSNNNGI